MDSSALHGVVFDRDEHPETSGKARLPGSRRESIDLSSSDCFFSLLEIVQKYFRHPKLVSGGRTFRGSLKTVGTFVGISNAICHMRAHPRPWATRTEPILKFYGYRFSVSKSVIYKKCSLDFQDRLFPSKPPPPGPVVVDLSIHCNPIQTFCNAIQTLLQLNFNDNTHVSSKILLQ